MDTLVIRGCVDAAKLLIVLRDVVRERLWSARVGDGGWGGDDDIVNVTMGRPYNRIFEVRVGSQTNPLG